MIKPEDLPNALRSRAAGWPGYPHPSDQAADLIEKLLVENAHLQVQWTDHDCTDEEFIPIWPDHFEPYGPIEGCLCGRPCGCTCDDEAATDPCPVERHRGTEPELQVRGEVWDEHEKER